MNLNKEATRFTSRHLVGRYFSTDMPAFVILDADKIDMEIDISTEQVVGYLKNLPAENFTIEWLTPIEQRKIVTVVELNPPLPTAMQPEGDYVSITYLEAASLNNGNLVPEVIVSGSGLDIYRGGVRIDQKAMLKDGMVEYAKASKDMTAFILIIIKMIDEDLFEGYQIDEPVLLNKKRIKNRKCPIASPIVLSINK